MDFNSSYYYASSGSISFCWFMTDLPDFPMFVGLIRGLKFIGESKLEDLSKPPVTRQVVIIFFKYPNKIDSRSLPNLNGFKYKPLFDDTQL